MALKIEPTPILKGQDAKNFEKKVSEDLERPSKLIATPKIEMARALVKKYAAKSGKK